MNYESMCDLTNRYTPPLDFTAYFRENELLPPNDGLHYQSSNLEEPYVTSEAQLPPVYHIMNDVPDNGNRFNGFPAELPYLYHVPMRVPIYHPSNMEEPYVTSEAQLPPAYHVINDVPDNENGFNRFPAELPYPYHVPMRAPIYHPSNLEEPYITSEAQLPPAYHVMNDVPDNGNGFNRFPAELPYPYHVPMRAPIYHPSNFMNLEAPLPPAYHIMNDVLDNGDRFPPPPPPPPAPSPPPEDIIVILESDDEDVILIT